MPDEKTFLLIRSKVNRRTLSGEKLWHRLEQAEKLGNYELEVPQDSHRKAPARLATLEVRCVICEIKCPRHDRKNHLKTVVLYAVEAKEVTPLCPEPILWRLVTTWPVTTFDEVLQVIEWYSCRWLVEEVFRILKTEGFNIEASELENGWAIRKLTVMMLDVIVKLMQMHIAYHQPETQSLEAELIFTKSEQLCLEALNEKVQGKTTKLQNPYTQLKRAVWVIARMGGWKGYTSQRPPGIITLFKGLERFYNIYDGWSLQRDVGTR